MHLPSVVPPSSIAAFTSQFDHYLLGHESIETTNVYVHANLAMKEKALAKIQPMDTPFRRFRPDDRLLAFLESLGRGQHPGARRRAPPCTLAVGPYTLRGVRKT